MSFQYAAFRNSLFMPLFERHDIVGFGLLRHREHLLGLIGRIEPAKLHAILAEEDIDLPADATAEEILDYLLARLPLAVMAEPNAPPRPVETGQTASSLLALGTAPAVQAGRDTAPPQDGAARTAAPEETDLFVFATAESSATAPQGTTTTQSGTGTPDPVPFALSHSVVAGPYDSQVEELAANMHRARHNLDDLADKIDTTGDIVKVARKALQQVVQLEKQADSFLSTVKSARFTLKISEKAGPLKVISKFLDGVLERVEEVATHVTYRAGQLRKKIEAGDYINKLKSAETRLKDAELKVKAAEFKAAEYEKTVALLDFVLDNDAGIFGTPSSGAEGLLNDALVPINDALDTLNTTYESIAGLGGDLDLLQGNFNLNASLGNFENVFDVISEVATAFGSVNASLDFLAGPLKALHSALKPIEWALDLVGFVFDITVGPILDWALETLGINKIMDKIGDAILAVLPDTGILRDIDLGLDGILDDIEAFLGSAANALGNRIDQLITDLENELMNQFDAALGFRLQFGTDGADTIDGNADRTEIINPLGGNDLVRGAFNNAGSQPDIYFASAGKDTLQGGSSDNDYLVLPGFVEDFKIVQVSADAPVVFYDREGRYGFEIVDYINGSVSIENFVFLDATNVAAVYTLAQLYDLGVVLDGGDSGPDYLEGGAAGEIFVHTDGIDTIIGNGGSDTWLLPNTGVTQGNTVVELFTESGFGDGAVPEEFFEGRAFVGGENNSDFLESIEDVILEQNREYGVYGSGKNNLILSNDSDDLILGYAGRDKILAGGGNDLIIAGWGADSVFGEGGNDTIFGGSVGNGQGNTYDGGAGRDRLIYSTQRSNYDLDSPNSNSFQNDDLTDSGSLRISTRLGMVRHMSDDLSTVRATDKVSGIETYIGGDQNDTIWGYQSDLLPGVDDLILDGGGGDDVLYSRGADTVRGGTGNDTLIADGPRDVLLSTAFEDGAVLDLTRYVDTRWAILNDFGARLDLRGIEVQDTEDPIEVTEDPDTGIVTVSEVAVPTVIFSGSATNIGTFLLGDGDDYLVDRGRESYDLYAGAGDDVIIRKQANDGSQFHNFYGGTGNDYLEISDESGNIWGEGGDDTIAYRSGSSNTTINGGWGDDLILLQRFSNSSELNRGILRGSNGFDTLSIVERFDRDTTRITVDLPNFNIATTGPSLSSFSDYWEGLVFDFESVIGSRFTPTHMIGTGGGERFIGLGANDTIQGRGGDDDLFGGGGNDLIEGGNGGDLIHMGAGDDTVDGDAGIDTLSFANARPESQTAAIITGNFGGVEVFLTNSTRISDTQRDGNPGQVRGAFGTGDIYEVENVIGSQNDDVITGNAGNNALSGSAGNDTLVGGDGRDVLSPGEGRDRAFGGRGNDVFLVTPGANALIGGAGFDFADFSVERGSVNIDLGAKTYTASIRQDIAVWANNGGTGRRDYDGQSLSPSDVAEMDPIFSNDPTDLTRRLPEIEEYYSDPKPPQFDIAFQTVTRSYDGALAGIEKVRGTTWADTIRGSDTADVIEGNGSGDLIIGGWGRDRLLGQGGNDTIRGDDGAAARHPVDLVYINDDSFPDYLMTTGFGGMPTQALTFEAVVRGLDNTPSDGVYPGMTLLSYAVPNSTNEFTVIFSETSVEYTQPYLRILVNGQVIDTTVPLEAIYDNSEHRLSVTWNGANGSIGIFVDGVKVWKETGLAAATGTISSGGTLIIGQDQDGATPGVVSSFSSLQDFEGGVGDIRMWQGVRSDAQIAANADGALTSTPGTLAGYWKMNANTDSIASVVGPTLEGFGSLRFEDGGTTDRLTHDTIFGGAGNDVLEGQKGNDQISGDAGADVLRGGDGNDILRGGNGNDRLVGQNGRDTLYGGRDLDTFVFFGDFGQDRIIGFAAHNGEKIDLSGVAAITGFNDLVNNHLSNQNGKAVITAGANTITLEGYVRADFSSSGPISADDFIF